MANDGEGLNLFPMVSSHLYYDTGTWAPARSSYFHLCALSVHLDYQSFYADVFNLRLFDLSPGLGLPPYIQNLILLYVSQHRSLTDRRRLPLTNWFLLEIGTVRRAQFKPTCSIFEQ